MLRFKSLGSGSTGNATLVERQKTPGAPPQRLLVDCGFGIKQLLLRLELAGVTPDSVNALFITHEHSDHVGCALAFARRWRVPVWMSSGTYAALDAPDFDGLLRLAQDGETIALDGLQVLPFTVPHDARQPLQLSCTDGQVKLGILTDLGHATPHVAKHLAQCNALHIEFNHDADLLANSSYPAFLKKRIGGAYGHLCNASAARIVRSLHHPALHTVVGAHLSVQNNRPELVRQALESAFADSTGAADAAQEQPTAPRLVMADAESGAAWLEV
jgi:phosphoribosyl 1,2-cyclic phosphodiesterase